MGGWRKEGEGRRNMDMGGVVWCEWVGVGGGEGGTSESVNPETSYSTPYMLRMEHESLHRLACEVSGEW